MTVESALKDWYEFKTQNGTTNVRPNGFEAIGAMGGSADSPYYLGFSIVEQARKRLTDRRGSYREHLLGGGTDRTFLEAEKREDVRFLIEVRKVLAERADEVEIAEKGRQMEVA